MDPIGLRVGERAHEPAEAHILFPGKGAKSIQACEIVRLELPLRRLSGLTLDPPIRLRVRQMEQSVVDRPLGSPVRLLQSGGVQVDRGPLDALIRPPVVARQSQDFGYPHWLPPRRAAEVAPPRR